MDKLAKKERSLLMSRVKTSGTDIEMLLQKIVRQFWNVERYRKNVKNLPGKPDIVFPKSRVAIFADGDFWHGKDFKKWSQKLPKFWKVKIEANLERDRRVNRLLYKMNYGVLRFWGSDLKKGKSGIAERIKKLINKV